MILNHPEIATGPGWRSFLSNFSIYKFISRIKLIILPSKERGLSHGLAFSEDWKVLWASFTFKSFDFEYFTVISDFSILTSLTNFLWNIFKWFSRSPPTMRYWYGVIQESVVNYYILSLQIIFSKCLCSWVLCTTAWCCSVDMPTYTSCRPNNVSLCHSI